MKAGVAVIKTVDIRKNDKSLSAAENGYDRRKHIVVAEKSVFGFNFLITYGIVFVYDRNDSHFKQGVKCVR